MRIFACNSCERLHNRESVESYPFQVSVHHIETVHIFQPIRGINQLEQLILIDALRVDIFTHESGTIDPFGHLYEFVDVTVNHPFGHHCKLARFWI